MRSQRRWFESGIGILALALLAGCDANVANVASGPAQTDTRAVDLDQTESVDVSLNMGGGELEVAGGAAKLMEGEFSFSPADLKPTIQYDTAGARGRLRIEEPSHTTFSHRTNRWQVRLNDTREIDLDVNFGAGQGTLTLGSLRLRGVNVKMGAGELRVDLRGTPAHDYAVRVAGGVGEATIYLPKDVGIVANVTGGLGDVNVVGLEKRNGQYVSHANAEAGTTITLDVKGGIGSIKLIRE